MYPLVQFSGFSSDSLAERILDSKAKVLITAGRFALSFQSTIICCIRICNLVLYHCLLVSSKLANCVTVVHVIIFTTSLHTLDLSTAALNVLSFRIFSPEPSSGNTVYLFSVLLPRGPSLKGFIHFCCAGCGGYVQLSCEKNKQNL